MTDINKPPHPWLLDEAGKKIPLTNEWPKHWHLRWIETHAAIFQDEYEQLKTAAGYVKLEGGFAGGREGRYRDDDRIFFNDSLAQFREAEERRLILVREIRQHIPDFRMKILDVMRWAYDEPFPNKTDFIEELREIVYHANRLAVPLEEKAKLAPQPQFAHPPTTDGYTVAMVTEMIGTSDTTLNSYAKQAGVPTPSRGQRNHRYSANQVCLILKTIVGKAVNQKLRARCEQALIDLENKPKLNPS